jgi:hypothetical protein
MEVFLFNWLGVPPCWRAYFFLLRQEKVAKKKATPGSAPASPVPCATRHWRGLRNSGFALRQSSPFFRQHLRCSAPLMGTPKGVSSLTGSQKTGHCGRLEKAQKPTVSTPVGREWFTRVPMRGAEQRRNVGGLRRGLSEGVARVPQPPDVSSSARDRATPGADPGVAFSLATFFWRSKRKYARQQGGTPSPLSTKHK